MGEYNIEGERNVNCLHLEVFASEDFKTFVQTAQREDEKLPQSFDWATILDAQSSRDHVSIFENLEAVFKKENLRMNEVFRKLFDLIDKGSQDNGDGILEVHELEKATKNPNIKEITNKYVVKHSSEWDKTQNMVDVLQNIVDNIDNSEFENKNKYIEMLKKEKIRIENLSFFNECRTIPDFPKSDMVYVVNPIGLVNEFNKGCQITKEMLVAMGCTTASNNQPLIDALNKYCEQYEINTCLRIAHFLAQAGHESGGFTSFEEDDTYQESIAMRCSSYATYRATPTGRTVQLTARKNRDGTTQKDAQGNVIYNCKQPEYFNCKYANKNGNGDFTSGDGHKYRGRGIIQLTGRNNYISYNTFHNTKNPNDTQDFVANPDLVKTNIEYRVESACWYWTEHGIVNSNINDVADRCSDDSVVLTVSKEVNGYGQAIPNGYNEPNKPLSRLPLFHKLKNYMGL